MATGEEEFRAGEFVPAGRYVRVDDAARRVIELREAGRLPSSFDGRVAIYCRLPDPLDLGAGVPEGLRRERRGIR
ncbi:MAG: hypothetical protein HYU88_01950 [Chloroflexi bacterium]|nr:hypothetical protein [Chloroflexota bacterium]MBI4504971.1 hypothetical protein [Chloroflexota bacterium]